MRIDDSYGGGFSFQGLWKLQEGRAEWSNEQAFKNVYLAVRNEANKTAGSDVSLLKSIVAKLALIFVIGYARLKLYMRSFSEVTFEKR